MVIRVGSDVPPLINLIYTKILVACIIGKTTFKNRTIVKQNNSIKQGGKITLLERFRF